MVILFLIGVNNNIKARHSIKPCSIANWHPWLHPGSVYDLYVMQRILYYKKLRH